MTITTQIITFTSSAVQFVGPTQGVQGRSRKVLAEPLRSNTHPCYVGTSAVTNDASGTGVIQELATPPAATIPCDRFVDEDQNGENRIEPGQYYAHGTSGEKLKVAIIQN
jgi:hypothetical protein